MSLYNFYTSRSAVECYQKCPRRRYYNYLYDGKGIVPKGVSIPLTTGTCVHKGIQHLLECLKNDQTINGMTVKQAILLSQENYIELIKNSGFQGVELDHEQQFIANEQAALTEGLIWVWALKELPVLKQRFNVVGVEREILVPLTSAIGFQARVDAELVDKNDGAHYLYSLKTIKQFDHYVERGYQKDLQGVTETWAYEQDTGKKTMGVRYCFLIKGRRELVDKKDPNSMKYTASPLIRGYKNVGLNGINYAHSLYFPKPENESGQGRLGKGWEPFNVWEDPDLGIVKWLGMIQKGKIQPECGDVLQGLCVTPPEYFRNEDDIKETMDDVAQQEYMVSQFHSERSYPKFRHSCHYPTDCDYLDMCWSSPDHDRVTDDPVGSGLFKIREPHHDAEREYVQI